MAQIYEASAFKAVSDIVTSNAILSGALAVLLLLFVAHYLSGTRLPPDLPRVQEQRRNRFGLRTRLAYYTDCESLYKEAYETVSSFLS